MGLFDFIRGELIEVIDWVETKPDIMLYKFPDKDANIKYGAQLTVRESQEVLFLDEGRFADHFLPGRHTLYTENMPILTTLKSWKHGFNSPFKSDVYFFSTKQFTNLKWGTSNPIMMRDPEFKQVRVRAFGAYFVKISDPKTFFTQFAGTKKVVRIGEVEEAMRDLIAPKFAEALAESGISVMDMVANYTELGEKILPLLQDDFTPFGLELTKFQISSTTLPKKVEEFYDKMTNMNMVGDDMDKFTKFQTAEAIEKAASNPGGGGGEGIGMGMGFGMANMMMQNMQNQNQNTTQNQKTNQAAPQQQTKAEIIALLKELGSLKEMGILSEEEFDVKKKELLSKL